MKYFIFIFILSISVQAQPRWVSDPLVVNTTDTITIPTPFIVDSISVFDEFVQDLRYQIHGIVPESIPRYQHGYGAWEEIWPHRWYILGGFIALIVTVAIVSS